MPIAAHAEIDGESITVRGMVGRVDGSEIIQDSVSGNLDQRDALGLQLAENLLGKGADQILNELLQD